MSDVKCVNVADVLRGRIKSGEWPEGTTLIMRRLAREYLVSSGTICGALSILSREGLVVLDLHNGGRWRVKAKPAPDEPPQLGASEDSDGVSDSRTPPPVNLLSLLDLGQGASLLTRAYKSAERVARELCPPDATQAQRTALYDFLHKIASEVRWPTR